MSICRLFRKFKVTKIRRRQLSPGPTPKYVQSDSEKILLMRIRYSERDHGSTVFTYCGVCRLSTLSKKISLFLVEDDQVLSSRLASITDGLRTSIRIIGEESSYSIAEREIRRLLPDVVAVSKQPGHLQFLQLVGSSINEVRTFACITTTDDLVPYWEADVKGVCTKNISARNLIAGILCVGYGDVFVEQSIFQETLRSKNSNGICEPRRHHALPSTAMFFDAAELSARELSVLRLLAHGARNREIANELYTSVSTIKNDIARILVKLRVDDRVEAAVYATKHGLI